MYSKMFAATSIPKKLELCGIAFGKYAYLGFLLGLNLLGRFLVLRSRGNLCLSALCGTCLSRCLHTS